MTNAEEEGPIDMHAALFKILTLAYLTWLIANVTVQNWRTQRLVETDVIIMNLADVLTCQKCFQRCLL